MSARLKKMLPHRAGQFHCALVSLGLSLSLCTLSFQVAAQVAAKPESPATSVVSTTPATTATPAATTTPAAATPAITTSASTTSASTTSAATTAPVAQTNFIDASPPVFYNSSVTAGNVTNPYFDSSIPLGDFQKKYYQSCFVYVFIKTFMRVQIINLSTHKVSSCPASEFRKITASSVAAQLKTAANVTLVGLVGPNFQMMDENNSAIEAESVPIGNLNFSPVMYADIGIGDVFHSWNIIKSMRRLFRWTNVDVTYNPIASRRNMDYVWYKGRTVYVMTTDLGQKYVMAFYNPVDIQNFKTEEYLVGRLNNLGNALNLPPGWTFKSIVLQKVLRLHQIPFQGYAGETMVDELDNVYIRAEELE